MKKTTLKRFMTLLLVLLWFVPSAVQAQTAEGSILSALEPITAKTLIGWKCWDITQKVVCRGMKLPFQRMENGWLPQRPAGWCFMTRRTANRSIFTPAEPCLVIGFFAGQFFAGVQLLRAGDVIWGNAGLPGVGGLPLSYSELTVRSIPDGKIRYQIR